MSTRISRNDATVQRFYSSPCTPCLRGGLCCEFPPTARRQSGFTLVELLVTVTIIAILAAAVLAALNAARQTARAAKTKATIAKLDQVIMRRYDSYMTRRVPISTSGMNPDDAARKRLDAIRDLMRMEMPERWNDVNDPPFNYITTSGVNIPRPALSQRYLQYYQSFTPPPTSPQETAECLYMIVAIGITTDLELFNQSEIGDVDGDGAMEFIDGWGKPISFLRWAPGFSSESDIQTGDGINDHDPFDTHNLEDSGVVFPTGAFNMIPLIVSGGPDKETGIRGNPLPPDPPLSFKGNPFQCMTIGAPDGTGDHYDNIHNHRIEAR